MSPRAKHELAREHLDRGLAGILADDTTEAVTWLFLSLEAAIVSVAGTTRPGHRATALAKG